MEFAIDTFGRFGPYSLVPFWGPIVSIDGKTADLVGHNDRHGATFTQIADAMDAWAIEKETAEKRKHS